MSDSPYSLRALGESLHARGYWVIGLRLPGHGTIPSGLKTVTWEDMAAAVSLAMDRLSEVAGADSLHFIGYSTGAPLALLYTLDSMKGSERPQPTSLVLISPAVGISPAAAGARWVQLLASIPGLGKLAWTQILPEFDPFKYNSFALNAGEQVHRLTRRVAREIESQAGSGAIGDFPSTLVFLSTVDATVTVDAVIGNLLERLDTDDHELVLFDINRQGVKSMLLVRDPGPLTISLMNDTTLPFHLTIVGNESRSSRRGTRHLARCRRSLHARSATSTTWLLSRRRHRIRLTGLRAPSPRGISRDRPHARPASRDRRIVAPRRAGVLRARR